MSEKRLRDLAARAAIREQLQVNLLVEAGAGSGKTTCLVERMVGLITGGCCRAGQMAAVTFTRKAAGELRERLQQQLERAAHASPESQAGKRARAALEELENTFVGTIHSFCARLLRERPVEAGLSPDFQELEGLEEQLLQERAWQEYLLQARLNYSRQLEELARVDLNPEDLQETYRELLLHQDLPLARGQRELPDLEPLREELVRLLDHARRSLPRNPPPEGWDALQSSLRQALRWQQAFDLDDNRLFLRLVAVLQRQGRPILKRWDSREEARALEESLRGFQKRSQPVLDAWREHRHGPALDFLLPAVEHYRSVRYRENRLNYQDLLLRGATLLRDNPEVRGYFQGRFPYLLVDEFQDTDPIQAQVMMYLAGHSRVEKDWKALIPRPGSLFVVGDPKQSIYRFRRADINVYLQVREQLRRGGGHIVRLTSNFRSVPAVINWCNQVFARLMQEDRAPYQAQFLPMEAMRPGGAGAEGAYRLDQEKPERRRKQDIVIRDAEAIAAWIQGALNRGLELTRAANQGSGREPARPDDFMILVRTKKHMSLYARALEQRGIPSLLSGEGDLQGITEIQHLWHVLQSLADPQDTIALTAALRGDYFGISDTDLYLLRQCGGELSLESEVPPALAHAVRAPLVQAWEALRRWRRWSLRLPPTAVIRRVAGELGTIPLGLTGELPRRRVGCFFQALELLGRWEQAGRASFCEAVAYLGQLLQGEVEEALDLAAGERAAVRVMNVHKAKGLEAPVVILANPAPVTSPAPRLHVRRAPGPGESEQALVPVVAGTSWQRRILAQPPDWAQWEAEETRYGQGEENRLLYVAATRARNLLLVSHLPAGGGEAQSPWQPLSERISAGWPTPVDPAPPLVAAGGRSLVSRSDLRRERARQQRRRHEASWPTYGRAAVTRGSTPAAEDTRPTSGAGGHGPSWGSALHYLLEAALSDRARPPWGPWARRAAEDFGLGAAAARYLELTLERVVASPFWERVQSAGHRCLEVPLAAWENGVLRQGNCDLAFSESRGWVLVDFKSDHPRNSRDLEKRVQAYTPQLQAYARLWEKATGQGVCECGLFFTSWCHYRAVDPGI